MIAVKEILVNGIKVKQTKAQKRVKNPSSVS